MSKYSSSQFKHVYNTARWKRISKLRRARNPLCQPCLERGFHTPATQTDHVHPLHLGGSPFDFNNTQSICNKCHIRKTNKEKTM